MSNRKALRELSHKFTAPPEVEKILNDLRTKDDYHVALLAVSIVEATLDRLIVSRLRKTDNEFLNSLFQNRGPLSDFNSKILVAEAFGIVTSPLAAELHSMRVVRNAFAHAKMPISFTEPAVETEVKSSKLLDAMRSIKIPVSGGDPRPLTLNSKSSFLFAVRITLIMLNEIAKFKSPAEKVIARALRKK
jgi:DNA-binding MltR family transcriptional regulator